MFTTIGVLSARIVVLKIQASDHPGWPIIHNVDLALVNSIAQYVLTRTSQIILSYNVNNATGGFLSFYLSSISHRPLLSMYALKIRNT